jgi:hypothetical protein
LLNSSSYFNLFTCAWHFFILHSNMPLMWCISPPKWKNPKVKSQKINPTNFTFHFLNSTFQYHGNWPPSYFKFLHISWLWHKFSTIMLGFSHNLIWVVVSVYWFQIGDNSHQAILIWRSLLQILIFFQEALVGHFSSQFAFLIYQSTSYFGLRTHTSHTPWC